MGYRCPVCDAPQADGEHLANHLAFTAMLHGDDHEAWLDEHAEDWSAGGPADLIPRVTALAEEVDFETVFDDTTGGHDHDHDHGPDLEGSIADRTGHGRAPMDEEAREILDEAREMTKEMYGIDGDEGEETATNRESADEDGETEE